MGGALQAYARAPDPAHDDEAGAGPRPLAHAGPRPVFLHGMWRSGTTFVWSRFRAAEGVTAYFEPLGPALARLTPRRIGREGWRDAMARSRHPLMDQPYFAEYEPLMRGRGVRLYHRSFAADHFARLRDERDPDLEAYIASLLTHAWAEGHTPVLGFVLTGLRMARLRAAFGAYDVHIDRDSLAIWASYRRHAAEGTYNFFAGLFLILERNAAHPLFAPLAERFELRRGLEKMIKPRRFYRRTIDSLAPAESYGLVFWFWLLNLLHAASHADLILDMSLADEPGYAHGLEVQLRRECGLEVSFEGLQAVRQPRLPPLFDRSAAEADVLDRLPLEAAAAFFDAARVRARLGELAPAKAEILARVLERVEGNPKVTGD
ncbi:MAG TPA: hypothetical protein VGF71_06705 [Caulobacteraceae bacterium]|jgi:hypothetical protein